MVSGMEMAARTFFSSVSTSGRLRSSPEPPLHFTTLFTGHPKLISTVSKPSCSQTRAASDITSGSAPKSCAEIGCSSGSNTRYFIVRVVLAARVELTTPCELVNSVINSPQPPWWRMNRRNTVSVTPAMGASTVAGLMLTGPSMRPGGKWLILLF